jgi:hypothetical protein
VELEGQCQVLEQVFRYLLPIDDAGGDGVGHGRVVWALVYRTKRSLDGP